METRVLEAYVDSRAKKKKTTTCTWCVFFFLQLHGVKYCKLILYTKGYFLNITYVRQMPSLFCGTLAINEDSAKY